MSVVLAVSGLSTALLSGLPWAIATSSGMGDGEGEGDYGAIKISMGMLLEGAFLTLAAILLIAALTSFVWSRVVRARGRPTPS